MTQMRIVGPEQNRREAIILETDDQVGIGGFGDGVLLSRYRRPYPSGWHELVNGGCIFLLTYF